MSHAIEAAKSGRAACATCGDKIAKGTTRVAELYQDATHGRPLYEERYHGDGNYSRARSEHREAIQRFHHLECAIAKHPAVVATALKRPHDPALIEDRAELDRRLAAALEEERKARVAAATARLAPPVEAVADDPNLAPLLAQLAEAPDDPELIAIVGDLYQAKGDPRGELISIQLAIRNAKRERGPEVANPRGRTRAQQTEDTTTKDLGARRDQLLAHLTPRLDAADRCTWGSGFIRRLELGGKSAGHVQELAGLWSHASMRVLSELRIELPTASDAPVIAHLAEVLPRSLRVLEIAGPTTSAPSLQPLLAVLPRLRQLVLLGRLPDSTLAHDKLSSIVIAGLPFVHAPDAAVSLLSPARLPAVRELVLRDWVSARDPIGQLARSAWLPVLERLVIDRPTGVGMTPERMPLEWAQALAAGLAGHRLKQLEITSLAIPLPVRAALTPLCDELICPSHAIVLDDTTTHVTHATKPEWGKGKILKRANGKLEIAFGKEVRVLKADAPFLIPAPPDD